MTFDEQVAALRGKVEPKKFKGKKSDATPAQWAAYLDSQLAFRAANPGKVAEYTRRHYSKHRRKILSRAREQHGSNREQRVARMRDYYKRTRGRWLEYRRMYRAANPESVKQGMRAWYDANRDQVVADRRARHAERWHSDPQYRLSISLRGRLRDAIRGEAKSGSAVRDLGCSVADLRAHIEGQWCGGMTWETWGIGSGKWQIDHIFPLAKADLADRVQFLAVCNWRNLRPLWHDDHAPKGDTITPEAQALFDSLMAEFKAKEVSDA